MVCPSRCRRKRGEKGGREGGREGGRAGTYVLQSRHSPSSLHQEANPPDGITVKRIHGLVQHHQHVLLLDRGRAAFRSWGRAGGREGGREGGDFQCVERFLIQAELYA